jgi:Fic family protein
MAHRDLPPDILAYLRAHGRPAGAAEITAQMQLPRPTVNRALAALVRDGQLTKTGNGPALRYVPMAATDMASATPEPKPTSTARPDTPAQVLLASLSRPLGTRTPVSYDRSFVDEYIPNESSLLPRALAQSLYEHGRAQGQQPAGTVARKVLEQLLIDLSWHSSRLEGNRKSLLDTRELFAGRAADTTDPDVTMLLNHKEAIEFLVDAVPEQGVTVQVVRNLHALLLQNLLEDPNSAGAIRRRIVIIDSSVYQPTHLPMLLEEMLRVLVDKARQIRNPIEGAFFLWVNIAYLQPFEDGNKRTSRLCANLPLLLSNCAPLSFLGVEPDEYACAMMGVYEECNVALAVELFEATYRRSILKYHAALEAFGAADPLRLRYRPRLGESIRRVIGGEELADILPELQIPDADRDAFLGLVRTELAHLESWNCARYRVPMSAVEAWIAQGRPRVP